MIREMKNGNKILAWTWELPQTLCAIFLIYVVDGGISYEEWGVGGVCFRRLSRGLFGAGVCLGEYILFDKARGMTADDVLHEWGHCRQSRMLGWLYLPVVGLVSAARNIYDRIAHKRWLWHERVRWYYGGWPESWADSLGGVVR